MSDRDRGQVSYATAAAAVEAILRNAEVDFLRRLDIELDGDASAPSNPFDWSTAAQAIRADASAMFEGVEEYWRLDGALRNADDASASAIIREAMAIWADDNWSVLAKRAREDAIQAFSATYYYNRDDFTTLLERWPRLADDGELRGRALRLLEEREIAAELAIPRLSLLEGDHSDLVRVLRSIVPVNGANEGGDAVVELIGRWGEAGTWRSLQQALREHVDEGADTEGVAPVAALLREFGLTVTGDVEYELSGLSSETRAAWRADLVRAVGDDAPLRSAATEALLWYSPTRVDRAAILAVVDLYRGRSLDDLVALLRHEVPLVRRRAAAVVDLAKGVPDVGEMLLAAGSSRVHGTADPSKSRTWIGDHRIEGLIEDALQSAAVEFADEVRDARSSGEETLVAVLFERLRSALKAVSSRLEALAVEQDPNELLQFRLEHRIVGKAEEGGPGGGSKRFSTDVCVVFTACDDGRGFARRASLVQAKRLHVRGSGLDVDYYPVDRTQIQDIASQTPASFMLLVGPQDEGVAMPVIPARLFLDMVERGSPSSSIAPPVAARLGKSVAQWLLLDVIGLWTGDCRDAIVRKAEGGEGARPFLLVEVVADRLRRGPDGWPRARR